MVDFFKILKLNKATGPDGISNRMLKLTHSTVSYPLTKLFNLSLKTHTYTDLWKIAHVMPLFKKGEKSFSKFYRRYYDLISKFQVGLKSFLRQGLSEPDFYGDLVYKLKKIVGSNNFSAQFIKIISHYKKDWL